MLNDKSSDEKREGKLPDNDITPVLRGWDYEPGTINVRKIAGADGLPKLQMRLDLGLYQMEMTGRPDGLRPHGFESLLDYYEAQLRKHEASHGMEAGFKLSRNQCQLLRDEAAMYYHRYLSLFVLEDFDGVVRDTERNLRVLDFCGKFATDEEDRWMLEPYRPYIVMMNSRAGASQAMQQTRYADALEIVHEGLAAIKGFFNRIGQEKAFGHSNEVRVLKRMAREIRRKMPVDPVQKLQNRLAKAVKLERYELAARLRDEIAKLKELQNSGGENSTTSLA